MTWPDMWTAQSDMDYYEAKNGPWPEDEEPEELPEPEAIPLPEGDCPF